MAFDKIVANSGDGLGAGFAFDTFTDTDAVEKIMTYTALAFGALDGGYTVVTTTDRFPVALSVLPDTAAGDLAAINAALAGTLTVGSHAVTNAGTFAVQAAQSGAWVVDLGTNNDVTVTSGAINATLDAETTKVIGTVNVAAAQTIGVTGTFWQATQPVSVASVPSHDVTNAGTFAVQSTLNAETTKIIGTVNIAAAQTITVTATALDVRALTNADVVTAEIAAAQTLAAVTSITNPVTVEHSTGSVGDGIKNVTTAGVREALAGSTACKWVMIQARTGNTGHIAVGGATVVANVTTGRGTHLSADRSVTLLIDNLADVSIDATVSGEGVYYTYGAA